jgi:hypothetical protein
VYAVTHETAMSDMWGSIFWARGARGAGGGEEGEEGEAWWMWSAREGGSEVSVGQLLAIVGGGGGGGDGAGVEEELGEAGVVVVREGERWCEDAMAHVWREARQAVRLRQARRRRLLALHGSGVLARW